MATRPASSYSTRHSLKAEPGAGLTRAGLQGKEWARPLSSWGTETRCHPNAADPRGKPDRGATAVGRGPGDGRKGLRDRPRATLTGRPSVPERGTARSAGDCSGRRQPTRRLGGGGSYVCSHTERWPKPPRGGAPGAQRLLCAPSKHEPPGRLRRAPGAPSLPVPGPRSPVRRPSFTSRGAPTRLCFLPLELRRLTRTTADTSCVPCATRGRACARRVPGAALRAGRR